MIPISNLPEAIDHSGPGLDVLNCGAGHLKFEFSKASPEEVEHAKKIITDMLERGYILFIEHDGKTSRVTEFDPEKEVYIIQEGPKKKRGRKKGVPMTKARATGVGRTAGG